MMTFLSPEHSVYAKLCPMKLNTSLLSHFTLPTPEGIIIPVLQMRDWDTEKLRYMLKVTQLVCVAEPAS